MSKIVGIDIGGTKMLMYSNYNGKIVQEKVPTGTEATPQGLVDQIHKFISKLDFVPDAVGVCVPGLCENGTLFYASDRRNLEGISEEMISTSQYKAYIINDLRGAMFSQIPKYPKGSSICTIVIGTGIGMSVVMDGHFLHGANGFVGEWGMCPVCLEDGTFSTNDRVMTGKAIVERTGLEPNEIIKKLDEGDERVVKIVNTAALYCGMCLAYCINLFNPNYLIFTGSTTFYKNYRQIAIDTCKKYAIKESFDSCTIVDPEEKGDIVIRGTMEYARMMFEGCEMP